MKEMKIVITEDNHNLAKAISEKLRIIDESITICFRAKNGIDLLERLHEQQDIDIILMDIEMPEMDGIEATAEVHSKYPRIKIIMLTVFDDEEKIFSAIRAGASGYLLKDETPLKIKEALTDMMAGGAPMSPIIASKTLSLLRNGQGNQSFKPSKNFKLSEREIEVLEKICEGNNYQQIASVLFLAPATVRKHIENIYKKLQVHNKVQAVDKARKFNIV